MTQNLDVQERKEEWKTGICDCYKNIPDCCFAYWCFPCFVCYTTRLYGEPLCLPLLEYLACGFPAISSLMRTSMRQRYGIRGSMCEDFAVSCCCGPCSWCQISRELKKRKKAVVIVSSELS